MARYKKEVKISEISAKGKNRVRKRFGDIVVFEMDTDREKLMLQKFQEIDDMKVDKQLRNILIAHSSLTIFTNVRVDVEDEEFMAILTDTPTDLANAIMEVEMMIAERTSRVLQQIEHTRLLAKLKSMTPADGETIE